MNNLFEHEIIPHNSATSPVENLATEVSKGFEKVSEKLKNNKLIPNIYEVIGNYVLLDLNYHGESKDRVETFSMQQDSKDLDLRFTPTEDLISISYIDEYNSVKYLTQKQPTQELKSTEDFKLLGKTVILAGNFLGKTLEVKYTGTRNAIDGLKLKPNVLKDSDNTFLKSLEETDKYTYKISYDRDLQSDKDILINKDSNVYLLAKESEEFIAIPFVSYTLQSNNILFTLSEELEKDYKEVVVYVLNTSVSDLLVALYYEMYSHDHSKDGETKGIKHKDILDNYNNSEAIFYKDSETPNYTHPQYFNREGYNPSITSAYENSLLGDLFLAASVSKNDQEYKSILKDSVSILFSDPVAGSKLYFNSKTKCITLLSGSSLNGLNIVAGKDKKALLINNDSYLSENDNEAIFKGKNNILSVIGEEGESKILSDNISVKNTLKSSSINSDYLSIGDVQFKTKDKDLIVTSTEESKMYFTNDAILSKATIVKGEIEDVLLKDKIRVKDEVYLKNNNGSFEFNLKDSKVIFKQLSGMSSGISLKTESDNFINIFGANSTGESSYSPTSNFFFESSQNSSISFLKDTSLPINFEGKNYSFNKDVSDSVKITDLKDWIKTDVNLGKLKTYEGEFDQSSASSKKGIKVGETRFYVVGKGLDCPEGSTLIESKLPLYLINSLGEGQSDCKDITYQNLYSGSIEANGDLSSSGNGLILGNLKIGEEITANQLTVKDTTLLNELNVSSSSEFNGETVFNNLVNFHNNLIASGSLELKGNLSTSSLIVDKYLEVGQNLEVTGQTYLKDDLIVQSDASIEGQLTVGTEIKSDSISTGDIKSSNIDAKGEVKARGGLEVTGKTSIEGNTVIEGILQAQSLKISKDIVADSVYVMSDTTLIGKFQVDSSSVNIATNSLSLGNENASLLFRGNLQVAGEKNTFTGNLNVQGDAIFSSSVKISNDLTVSNKTTTVSLEVRSDTVIKGSLTASSAEFSKKVYFLDGINIKGEGSFSSLVSDKAVYKETRTNDLYIQDTLSMGPDARIISFYVETSNFLQKDPSGTSTFSGMTYFNNSNFFSKDIIIGNSDIKNKRNTSGCLITDNQIKMGNNSTIEAVKFYASKGTPVGGNKDLNAGYTFSSPYIDSGTDGDTGLFATTGNDAGLDGSNLEIWIDGVRKYSFSKENIEYNDTREETQATVVTLDMLQKMEKDLIGKFEATLAATTSNAHPIGSIYLTMNEQNPYSLFKFGTWVRFSPGRTLVGRVSDNLNETGGTLSGGLVSPKGFDLKTAGSVYGEFEHELTKAELPDEPLELQGTSYHSWIGNRNGVEKYNIPNKDGTDSTRYYTKPMGDGVPHNNVQPSTVVNMWHRIA